MGGTATALLEQGARCIIAVDDVNTPTGWWWGIVDKAADHGTYVSVDAHITGPFQFEPGGIYRNEVPLYGDAHIQPAVNYRIYPDTRDIRELIRESSRAASTARKERHDLATRLDELRGLLKTMSTSPEAIAQAIRDGLKAPS